MARVLVVGGGIAGLWTAVKAADAGHSVELVTKTVLADGNTRHAQGGIAAALFPDDSVERHYADTIAAGAGLSDPAAVRVLCDEGPARVRDLIRFGEERVIGAHVRDGSFTEKDCAIGPHLVVRNDLAP